MPQAVLSLTAALLEPPGNLPSGHLALINALQAKRGKTALTEGDLIARPVRLTGNQLTCYFTKFPDDELAAFAQQCKENGAPLLSAHITDDRPIGTFYAAEVASDDGALWLDTFAYWLADDKGLELARDVDAGIINEASIGFSYDQAVCSICGEDWLTSWECPHWPGHTYQIPNGNGKDDFEERLCFLWTVGCTFDEGSVVYRGGHEGTKVGGTLSREFVPLVGAPTQGQEAPHLTSFQLQATRDMASLYAKKAKPPAGKLGKPSPGPQAEQPQAPEPEGDHVKFRLKKNSGQVVEVETQEELQTLLDEGFELGKEKGQQEHLEYVGAQLGLEPKDVSDVRLGQLKDQAAAGELYRKSLETRLSKAVVAVEGQGNAATRIEKLGKKADLPDLEGLVEDWEAKLEKTVPNSQQSKEESDGVAPKPAPRVDSV